MLPIFTTNNKDMLLLQTNWAKQINPVIDLPTNQGQLLQNVSLLSGSNTINHKLGRKLQGWFATRIRASATLYDQQDSNSMADLTLILVASANVKVDLFVF